MISFAETKYRAFCTFAQERHQQQKLVLHIQSLTLLD